MAFQRLDLLAKDLDVDDIKSALGEVEPDDLFLLDRSDGLNIATLILDEAMTEPAIEALEKRYSDCEQFQLLVYDISARLPRQDEKDQEQNGKVKDARDRISKEELLDDLEPGSRIRGIYIAQVVISCIVAAVGMIRDSVELVIAAMVIAPLLTPSMSLALGTTIGDLRMIWRSILTSAVGIGVGLFISVIIGFIVPINSEAQQLTSRGEVRYTDLVVAIAAGAAGALAVTTGVSAALIGVMVAVALVPPLVAAGLFVGSGEFDAASGALILLASNVICVNLAAVGVFLIQGIRPSNWAEQKRAKAAVRHALIIWLILLTAMVLLIGFAAPENPLK